MQPLGLLVVGQGPTGIAAAIEARRAGIPADRVLVLDGAPAADRPTRRLAPLLRALPAPGAERPTPRLRREDLPAGDDALVSYRDFAIRTGETVRAIRALEDPREGFLVQSQRGVYRTHAVVVTIGFAARSRRPRYPLPTTMRNRILFETLSAVGPGEDLLVVGEDDGAADRGATLAQRARRLTLAIGGKDLARMTDERRQLMLALERAGKLRLWRGCDVHAVEDGGGRLRVFFHPAGSPPHIFDRIVYALGAPTPEELLAVVGIDFRRLQSTPGTAEDADVPGLFLCGDSPLTMQHVYQQVVSAATA